MSLDQTHAEAERERSGCYFSMPDGAKEDNYRGDLLGNNGSGRQGKNLKRGRPIGSRKKEFECCMDVNLHDNERNRRRKM